MRKITLILFLSLIYLTGFTQVYGIRQNENGKYYFINKNGEPVNKLGEWDNAEQFDGNRARLAKVEKEEELIHCFTPYVLVALKRDRLIENLI